jgi:hypothetical protein
MENLTQVELMAVERAVRTLQNINGIEFKVRGRGYSHGVWHEKEVKRTRKNQGITSYVREFLPTEIKPGEVVVIWGTKIYPTRAMQAVVSSLMTARYGRGSYCTSLNRKENTIEVLFTGDTKGEAVSSDPAHLTQTAI